MKIRITMHRKNETYFKQWFPKQNKETEQVLWIGMESATYVTSEVFIDVP